MLKEGEKISMVSPELHTKEFINKATFLTPSPQSPPIDGGGLHTPAPLSRGEFPLPWWERARVRGCGLIWSY